MRLKRLFLLGLAFTACCFFIQVNAQVDFGVRAGGNFFNVSSKDAGGNKTDDFSLNPGFHFGITVGATIADKLELQPGLLFYTKGFQGEYIEPTVTTASTATAFYLELPVNVIYKPELGTGNLLLGAGPYIAYGVGGNFTRTTKVWNEIEEVGSFITTTKEELKMQFVNDRADANARKILYGKPFDYGANLLAGYELKNGLSAQLNAQLGLANLTPLDDGKKQDGSLKNVGFGISLGYRF